jgi:iron(III) transport system substrate-binding protein
MAERSRRWLASLALLACAQWAWAQAVAPIALYEGGDRQARLVAGARKEGSLLLYASTPIEYLRVIIDAFEAKYGVKVNLWRSRSENLLQRIVSEARGGSPMFDVVESITPPIEAMRREGMLQRVNAPVHDELLPWGVPPHREWAATQLYLFVQSYNTARVRKQDLPRTYADLLDPKWKGKLAIEASDHEWFYSVAKEIGEEKGLRFWRQLVATNGLQLRTGHSLLNNLVGAGEVALALTVYNSDPETLKKKGSPVDWFVIEPAIAIPNGVGVSRRAPHPHAAVLFYEYMLGEDAQRVLARIGYVTSQKKIEPAFRKPIKLLDPATLLDEHEQSNGLFEQIIVKGAAR